MKKMLRSNSAVYFGRENQAGFSGYIADNNFFLALEFSEGLNSEKGSDLITKISVESRNFAISNLTSFDLAISNLITKYNFPATFSLAAGYKKERIFYLKTVGGGKIFLKRGMRFAQIIEGDNSASGYLVDGDFYILTAQKFIDLLGSDLELKSIFDHKTPQEIAEEITEQLKNMDNEGSIALFIRFSTEVNETGGPYFNKPQQMQGKNDLFNQFKKNTIGYWQNFRAYSEKSGKRKITTLIAVVIIFFILIWSVGLGLKRRNLAGINEKVKFTKVLINQKLAEAEKAAFLNLPRSVALISEAKDELAKLKKEVGAEIKEAEELERLIKESENKIVKKEEKKPEEFYDLTLDSKQANGSKMYLDKDNLGIIDRGQGLIYILSLSKKSLEKKANSLVKKAELISVNNDGVLFFIGNEGVFKFTDDKKVEKVIGKDKDWSRITDIWVYNGNVYLLDSDKGDIYKYLVAEKGYSSKSSYLRSEAGKIKTANSMAIDGSVYIGFTDEIIKYTAGAKDDFSTLWPQKSPIISKIFTTADEEKVYAWDKANGSIYILGKNGSYERQIYASVLSKALDFIVFEKSAYVLVDEKIFKIDLR